MQKFNALDGRVRNCGYQDQEAPFDDYAQFFSILGTLSPIENYILGNSQSFESLDNYFLESLGL